MKVTDLSRAVKKQLKPIRKKSKTHNINFDKPLINVLTSIAKYEQGLVEINEDSFDELKSQLAFTNFEVEIETLNADVKSRIYSNVVNKEELDSSYAVRLFITNTFIENAECLEIYSLVGDIIPFKARKHLYYDILPSKKKKTKYKVLDLYYIVGFLSMLDTAQSYLEECKDEFFALGNYHKYFNCYDETFIERLCDLTYVQNLYVIKDISLIRLIADIYNIIILQRHQLQLEDESNKQATKEYARAFETKRNIPDKILDVMKSNEFLKDFTFVELDELTDIAKFRVIESEYLKLRIQLDFDNLFNKDLLPELRFRRLGKHNALGIYFSAFRCICVDIKSPTSFLHEVGHYIDLTANGKKLSSQFDFLKLHRAYTKQLDLNISKLDVGDRTAFKKKRNYYHTFTEVFARSFELYLGKIKNLNSSLLKSNEDFMPQRGYPELNDDLEIAITNYFDGFINLTEDIEEITPYNTSHFLFKILGRITEI